MEDHTLTSPEGFVPPNRVPGDDTDLLPKKLIDGSKYTLIRKLGGGGMGVVYLVNNVRMGRKEVLKLIHSAGTGSREYEDRFRQEVRAAGQLSHPNVVIGYGSEEIEGTLVLEMEFVDGINLDELVRHHGPLPIDKACDYVRQAALGLQHAHDRRLIHRDVKPHNLLLRREGGQEWVKVIDFGLVKAPALEHLRHAKTQVEQILGSPPYMAPEQWAGASQVDARADIYSLGCVLYFLLVGEPPFARSRDRQELMIAHVSDPPPDIRSLRSDVPEMLADLLTRMLAKKASQRPQSAAEVAQLLEQIRTGSAETVTTGSTVKSIPIWNASTVTHVTVHPMPAHSTLAEAGKKSNPLFQRMKQHFSLRFGMMVLLVPGMVGLGYWYFSESVGKYNFNLHSAEIHPKKENGDSWDALGGKPDPFIKLFVRYKNLVKKRSARTEAIKDQFHTDWNTPITTVDIDDEVLLQVWDQDLVNHDLIGEYRFIVTPEMITNEKQKVTFGKVDELIFSIVPREEAK